MINRWILGGTFNQVSCSYILLESQGGLNPSPIVTTPIPASTITTLVIMILSIYTISFNIAKRQILVICIYILPVVSVLFNSVHRPPARNTTGLYVNMLATVAHVTTVTVSIVRVITCQLIHVSMDLDKFVVGSYIYHDHLYAHLAANPQRFPALPCMGRAQVQQWKTLGIF